MFMCLHPDQRGVRVIERSHRRHARIDAPLDARRLDRCDG